MHRDRPKAIDWLAAGVLGLWLVGGTALGGVLLIRHLIALPTPAASDTVLGDALRAASPAHEWRAVHFMYRTCPCSRRTIDHLLAAPRPAGLTERVVMVDDDGAPGPQDAPLRASGFPVEVITPDQLHARYHVDAAPLFVVMTPDDEVAYVGGYNRHKQSAAYEDLAILDELHAAHRPAALPVFGCATSARLARIVDPLHLAAQP